MDVTPEFNFLLEAAGVSDPEAAAVVQEVGWSLDRYLGSFVSRKTEIGADRNLSEGGIASKRYELARSAVEGVPNVGNLRAVEALRGRRDVLLKNAGNRFHLTKKPGMTGEEAREVYREVRAELRAMLRDEPADRRDLALDAIVNEAVAAEDRALLGALFDSHAVAPSLSLMAADDLDALERRLFHAWAPEAAREAGELDSALQVDALNRARAGHEIARLANIPPAELGLE